MLGSYEKYVRLWFSMRDFWIRATDYFVKKELEEIVPALGF